MVWAIDDTKPYEFIGFGPIDDTKPYKFIGFGAIDDTKPYEFIGFGAFLGPPDSRRGCVRGRRRSMVVATTPVAAI